MLRDELKKLEKHSGDPLISVIAPMKKTFPGIKENPTVLKNQIKKVKEKLEAGYDTKVANHFLDRIDKIADNIDYENTGNGIGIFIAKDLEKVLKLPFEPREQVVVDKSFQVRDLVFTNNRTVRYWVLCLSESPTRLLEGFGNELNEVINDTFPAEYVSPESSRPYDPTRFARPDLDQIRDEHKRQYFRKIDEMVFDHLGESQLPLVLVGIKKNLSLFSDGARCQRFVIGNVEGNHVSKPEHELAKLTVPVVEKHLKKERDAALSQLEESIGENRYTSGLQSAWDLSKNGNIEKLLVEQNYYASAYLSEDRTQLYTGNPDTGSNNLIKLEDAVDDIIENVIRNNGKVYFLAEGRLEKHNKIAGITRY